MDKIRKFFAKVFDYCRKNWFKITFYLVILLCTITLIYILNFSTNWATGDMLQGQTIAGVVLFEGLDPRNNNFFTVMTHVFNQQTFGLILLIFVALLVAGLFGSVSRKKYYWTNYASVGVVTLLMLILSVYMFIRLPAIQNQANIMLADPQSWSNVRFNAQGNPVSMQTNNLVFVFWNNRAFHYSDLPPGWYGAGADFYQWHWSLEFLRTGIMPADTPQPLLDVISAIHRNFAFGYVLAVLLFVGALSFGAIILVKVKESRQKVLTYSDVEAQIIAGSVTVEASPKKVDFDDETIKINVKESQGQLEKLIIQYEDLKQQENPNKQELSKLRAKIRDLRVDKMRFQTNNSAYLLTFLAIILIVVAGFISINFAEYGSVDLAAGLTFVPLLGLVEVTMSHAIDIILIILTMLALFLCAEKMKYYKKNYVWVSLFFVGLTIGRIFFVPLHDHLLYLQPQSDDMFVGLPFRQFYTVLALLIAAAAIQLVASLTTLDRINRLEKHFELFGDK